MQKERNKTSIMCWSPIEGHSRPDVRNQYLSSGHYIYYITDKNWTQIYHSNTADITASKPTQLHQNLHNYIKTTLKPTQLHQDLHNYIKTYTTTSKPTQLHQNLHNYIKTYTTTSRLHQNLHNYVKTYIKIL